MGPLLAVLTTLGLAVGLACLIVPPRVAAALTVASGIVCFGLAAALVAPASTHVVSYGFLRADSLSVVFALAVGFVYATTAVYSVGYLAGERELPGYSRYARLFYAGVNLFAWAMLCAPLVNGLALVWIAIEVTTIVSALLVAIDNTKGAGEAAWKYVLIASSGLTVALLATIVMYYAGAAVLGEGFTLRIGELIRAGNSLPQTPVRLAFVLAVVGFGTKMGLVPIHTWLPDAHAEAPTPVSTMLSGALLVDSFYVILRYFQIATASLGSAFPRDVLLAFGIFSLALAAVVLLGQRDVKRLLAYSSIEHMGILAIGVSFGVPLAFYGVLLHVLAHAAAKGNAFFGAGAMLRKYHTKEIAAIRGGLDLLPWTAPLFLLAVLILSALPPFGIFRSEFAIVAGGMQAHGMAGAAVLVALVTIAFLGLALVTTRMLFLPREPDTRGDGEAAALRRGEPSVLMVVPMLAGMVVLAWLGIHPPPELLGLLHSAAGQLGAFA
jgi:hydrogenase-4 component F